MEGRSEVHVSISQLMKLDNGAQGARDARLSHASEP